MLLEKRSLALVLEYIMANILCFYPNGALEQGFSQLEIQVGGGPAKGPGYHTPVLKLGIQSSMTRDNMDKSWSKKFENQNLQLEAMLVLSRKQTCFSLQSFPDELQFCASL